MNRNSFAFDFIETSIAWYLQRLFRLFIIYRNDGAINRWWLKSDFPFRSSLFDRDISNCFIWSSWSRLCRRFNRREIFSRIFTISFGICWLEYRRPLALLTSTIFFFLRISISFHLRENLCLLLFDCVVVAPLLSSSLFVFFSFVVFVTFFNFLVDEAWAIQFYTWVNNSVFSF